MYKNIDELSQKKIALLGAGIETLALAKYLHKHGINCDLLEWDPLRIKEHKKYVQKVISTTDYLEQIIDYDLVVRSPGFPLFTIKDQLAKFTPQQAKKLRVTSAVELFMWLCPAYTIGITGTKGKGTTSSLLAHILQRAKRSVYLVGNIGKGVFDILDELKADDLVVLELSSFQLENITISPKLAIMLRIMPDHLEPLSSTSPNYHKSYPDYVAAKANLLRFQEAGDWAIINHDYEYPRGLASLTKARVVYFSSQLQPEQGAQIDIANGSVHIAIGGKETDLDIAKRQLLGRHNLENIAAAACAAVILGVEKDQIYAGINSFKGLKHRMELVAEGKNIRFVNDSYATTPDATIAAIKAFDEPTHLILGGSSKGADFDALITALQKSKVAYIALIGQEGKKLEALFEERGITNFQYCSSLDKAFSRTVSKASKNSSQTTILLSPACASTDMFINAAERGEQFTQLAKEYIADHES